MKTVCLAIFVATLVASVAYAIDSRKIIDMTYAFGPDALYWPTAKSFELETVAARRVEANGFDAAFFYEKFAGLPGKSWEVQIGNTARFVGALQIFALLP